MMIAVNDVSKSFAHGGGSVDVLRSVNLTVAPNETVTILGPSGSGKTTLLAILAGLDAPTAGTVAIAGQDIGQLNESALAKFRAQTLSIVFQRFHLMPTLTAIENISLPLEIAGDQDANAKALAALEQVSLGHRADHFPKELSGGECQRVAIARAIVSEPRLLLADEPSGNLDQDTGAHVMDLLFDLVQRRQTTLVLVTHNLELAKRCRRQLVLRNGVLT